MLSQTNIQSLIFCDKVSSFDSSSLIKFQQINFS